MPKLLVIIVNYRSAKLTIGALRSLESARARYADLRAVVVENDSGDGDFLTEELGSDEFHDWVSLICSERNGGFAYGNNLAVRQALGEEEPPDLFFLFNPDAVVRGAGLERLVEFLDKNPQAGIVGPRLENADGSEWNWAFRFPNLLAEFDSGLRLGVVSKLLEKYRVMRAVGSEPVRVDWLPGAALLIRREVFQNVGLMDEGYFLYYEETDFLLRAARAGFECWYTPDATVMHISGQSTGVTSRDGVSKRLPSYWFESRRRFFIENFGLPYAIAADLAYMAGVGLCNLRTTIRPTSRTHPPHLLRDLAAHFSARRVGPGRT